MIQSAGRPHCPVSNPLATDLSIPIFAAMGVGANVIVIITTYRRPGLLRRLLRSLAAARSEALSCVVVVDDSGQDETEVMVRECPLPCRYLKHTAGRGLGAGHAAGLLAAFTDGAVTHALLLDDDVEVPPGALDELLRGMADAEIAVPIIVDETGTVRAFPGLLDRNRWRTIRRPGIKPDEYVRHCGPAPVTFTWTPWCALLVSRSAFEAVGLPRSDFGFMCEDIEFSLRLTARCRAVLVPAAVVRHLPPRPKTGLLGYYTDCLGLQNITYVALRLSHGHRALRHLPGNYYRFLRRWGPGLAACRDAATAGWRGAALGRAAGMGQGRGFLARWKKVMSA